MIENSEILERVQLLSPGSRQSRDLKNGDRGKFKIKNSRALKRAL